MESKEYLNKKKIVSIKINPMIIRSIYNYNTNSYTYNKKQFLSINILLFKTLSKSNNKVSISFCNISMPSSYVLNKFFSLCNSKRVAAVIKGILRMAFYPVIVHLMLRNKNKQCFPQIRVECRLFIGFFPAVLFPRTPAPLPLPISPAR